MGSKTNSFKEGDIVVTKKEYVGMWTTRDWEPLEEGPFKILNVDKHKAYTIGKFPSLKEIEVEDIEILPNIWWNSNYFEFATTQPSKSILETE